MLIGFYGGFVLYLDTDELSLLGETLALINGHKTFHLVEPNIYRRNCLSINAHPVPFDGTVHRTHLCGNSAVIPAGRRAQPEPVPPTCDF